MKLSISLRTNVQHLRLVNVSVKLHWSQWRTWKMHCIVKTFSYLKLKTELSNGWMLVQLKMSNEYMWIWKTAFLFSNDRLAVPQWSGKKKNKKNLNNCMRYRLSQEANLILIWSIDICQPSKIGVRHRL